MGRVSGRSCIVTGAARGIGRAIGEALLDEGADVCFALLPEGLDELGGCVANVRFERLADGDRQEGGPEWPLLAVCITAFA